MAGPGSLTNRSTTPKGPRQNGALFFTSQPQHRIYRDLLRPIAEVDALGNVVARYVYADGDGAKQNGVKQLETRLGVNQDTSLPFSGDNVPELIQVLSNGTVTQTARLVKNQVGTVQAVVDVATGAVVQRLEHDEFGRVLFDSNPGLQPFGFAGGL